jgi:hypothetical protein
MAGRTVMVRSMEEVMREINELSEAEFKSKLRGMEVNRQTVFITTIGIPLFFLAQHFFG